MVSPLFSDLSVLTRDWRFPGRTAIDGAQEPQRRAVTASAGSPLTGADLAALYTSVDGNAVEALSVDDATWIADAVAHGLPEGAAENVTSFGRAIREGARAQRSGDVEQLTGRKPASVSHVLKGASRVNS